MNKITTFLSILFLSSCAYNPELQRRQLNFLGGEEIKLGLEEFEKYKKKHKISGNSNYQNKVKRVGKRIASVIPSKQQWEFVVFEDKSPNAFALPGGKVGINTGIFQYTVNDTGLATVMAHEIAHVLASHSAERVSQHTLTGAGLGLLKSKTSDNPMIGAALGLGANVGYLLPFSRKQELEADKLGLNYMAKAGYDPTGAISFWQRFAKAKNKAKAPAFLSTHPVDSVRIEKLRKHLPNALRYYNGGSNSNYSPSTSNNLRAVNPNSHSVRAKRVGR